jgi:hypothetical protein
MELTQEQINNLALHYKCCFSNKGEDLIKSIRRQGKDCKCKSRKLLFLQELQKIVQCYTLGKEIEHRAEIPSFFLFRTDIEVTGSFFNIQINSNDLPEFKIDGVTFFNGNNIASPTLTTSGETIIWINKYITNNLINDYDSLYFASTNNSYIIYSPPGEALNWDNSTLVNVEGNDFTVNGSVQELFRLTFTSGLNTILIKFSLGTTMFQGSASIVKEYTTEQLNCLSKEQLTNIIEYLNKECDCCI